MIWLLPFFGAVLSRAHGGGFISNVPKLLKAFIWAFPFAWVSCLSLNEHLDLKISIALSVVVLASCMVFKNTGHGNATDLGTEPQRGKEKLEFFVFELKDVLTKYEYDLLVLSVIGFFSTLAPALAIGYFMPLCGALILFGGMIGKPLAYMIGWRLIPDFKGKYVNATEIGEILTGFFAYLPLSITLMELMNV